MIIVKKAKNLKQATEGGGGKEGGRISKYASGVNKFTE